MLGYIVVATSSRRYFTIAEGYDSHGGPARGADWMTKQYDVAIIGLGTMGSFAAVELARRGLTVAGFDQFTPPHGRGSHSGGTRIYRLAYPEGTGYVPLAQRAGEMWEQAGEELGTQLLHRSGMLYMGLPGEPFLREVQESASTNQLRGRNALGSRGALSLSRLRNPGRVRWAIRCAGRLARCGCVDRIQSCLRPKTGCPMLFRATGDGVGRQPAAK